MPDSIEYRLPVTVVRIRGTRITTTSSLDADPKPERIERQATTDVDVVSDPRVRFEVRSPSGAGWHDRQVSLGVMTDGRLKTAGAEVTDRSGERLRAIATIGTTVAGGLVAVGASPLVGAAVGIAAVAGGMMHLLGNRVIEELDEKGYSGTQLEQEVVARGAETTCPSASDLGIRSAYKREHRADFELLYAYRRALLQLTAEHAAAALGVATPATKAEQLRGFDAALKSTRAEAKLVGGVRSPV